MTMDYVKIICDVLHEVKKALMISDDPSYKEGVIDTIGCIKTQLKEMIHKEVLDKYGLEIETSWWEKYE